MARSEGTRKYRIVVKDGKPRVESRIERRVSIKIGRAREWRVQAVPPWTSLVYHVAESPEAAVLAAIERLDGETSRANVTVAEMEGKVAALRQQMQENVRLMGEIRHLT